MHSFIGPFLGFLFCLQLSTGCGQADSQQPGANTATLRIGEAIQFSTGKVTTLASEGDMVFRYLPPQSPHGWRYNPATGQIEYQAQAGSNQNYPLLSAAKSAAFKTMPPTNKLTAGDINQWTEDEFDIGPGRFIVVRGYRELKHWLIRVQSLTASSNDPKTWALKFTYEPLTISAGSAGSAGQGFPLHGHLVFRERLNSEKIISLALADGKVTGIADGYGVSGNEQGQTAYVDTRQMIMVTGKDHRSFQLSPPQSASTENTVGGTGFMEAVISPSGRYVAVGGITRRKTYTAGGISLESIPEPSIAVIDTGGKELASFVSASYPAWIPGGGLMMADLETGGIVYTDASFKKITPIPRIPAGRIDGISISPDGKRVALALNQRIWIMDSGGGQMRQLTSSGLAEVTPVWSPDGQYLAFQQSIPGKKEFFQVLVMRMSDGKTQIVTDHLGANREPMGRMSWVP